MHAVVLNVTVNDANAATAALRNQVVPQVSGTPGFVAGYWVRLEGDRGTSVVVFESEDAARSAAAQAQPPGAFLTFDSVEVGEVVANA
jgi:heme-degrading monooxygenase HmoA